MTLVLDGFGYPDERLPSPFWEGVARRELTVARCESCGRHFAPFSVSCCYCGSPELTHHRVDGSGELYTWTVCHRAMDPMFAGAVPYVVGAVRLREGAVFYSRIVEVTVTELAAGMALELCWQHIDPGSQWMWAFRPVGDG